uniref:Uncharacterized protein n=1 Tax=Sipha flava TaxID=143950 RepID=A0A2S2QY32_9HEMI
MNPSKKRKRTKLECLTFGSTFDHDYKRKREINVHGGNRINVKHFGAPDNPFVVASAVFKKSVQSEVQPPPNIEEVKGNFSNLSLKLETIPIQLISSHVSNTISELHFLNYEFLQKLILYYLKKILNIDG